MRERMIDTDIDACIYIERERGERCRYKDRQIDKEEYISYLDIDKQIDKLIDTYIDRLTDRCAL